MVLSPHMDDEVLACGATLAGLRRKDAIHVVYATDGSRSPAHPVSWGNHRAADLPGLRRREAMAAMEALGVPRTNLHFLDLPDGRLRAHAEALRSGVASLVEAFTPDHLLIPFRYDRHRDHIALNRAGRAVAGGRAGLEVMEYFVYTRWRLLPSGDVRTYIGPERLVAVDTAAAAERKRRALRCFRTQTTRMYPWQHRPTLSPEILEQVCEGPEIFLVPPRVPGDGRLFVTAGWWIRTAHALEPRMKRGKDWLVAMVRQRRRPGT